jgi:hypothetical protein
MKVSAGEEAWRGHWPQVDLVELLLPQPPPQLPPHMREKINYMVQRARFA